MQTGLCNMRVWCVIEYLLEVVFWEIEIGGSAFDVIKIFGKSLDICKVELPIWIIGSFVFYRLRKRIWCWVKISYEQFWRCIKFNMNCYNLILSIRIINYIFLITLFITYWLYRNKKKTLIISRITNTTR